jgi:hypothetical protein
LPVRFSFSASPLRSTKSFHQSNSQIVHNAACRLFNALVFCP